jgi:hypothetical protein
LASLVFQQFLGPAGYTFILAGMEIIGQLREDRVFAFVGLPPLNGLLPFTQVVKTQWNFASILLVSSHSALKFNHHPVLGSFSFRRSRWTRTKVLLSRRLISALVEESADALMIDTESAGVEEEKDDTVEAIATAG